MRFSKGWVLAAPVAVLAVLATCLAADPGSKDDPAPG